jgi:hypothetical protein
VVVKHDGVRESHGTPGGMQPWNDLTHSGIKKECSKILRQGLSRGHWYAKTRG